jgi:hypothetical protein
MHQVGRIAVSDTYQEFNGFAEIPQGILPKNPLNREGESQEGSMSLPGLTSQSEHAERTE